MDDSRVSSLILKKKKLLELKNTEMLQMIWDLAASDSFPIQSVMFWFLMSSILLPSESDALCIFYLSCI